MGLYNGKYPIHVAPRFLQNEVGVNTSNIHTKFQNKSMQKFGKMKKINDEDGHGVITRVTRTH